MGTVTNSLTPFDRNLLGREPALDLRPRNEHADQ
jgi:hypothetical protein